MQVSAGATYDPSLVPNLPKKAEPDKPKRDEKKGGETALPDSLAARCCSRD